MKYHISNPPLDFQLSYLNWFEISLYNKCYTLDKSDQYSRNDELETKVYKGDKLFCTITHYINFCEEFSVEYENKTVQYFNGKKTNAYLKKILEDQIIFQI